MHFESVTIATYHMQAVEAITTPSSWPRFQSLLEQVSSLCSLFESVSFECEKVSANSIARDISKSVMRDGRLQSYFALGGSAWLHQRLLREAARQD